MDELTETPQLFSLLPQSATGTRGRRDDHGQLASVQTLGNLSCTEAMPFTATSYLLEGLT